MSDEYLSLSGTDPRVAGRPPFEFGTTLRTTFSVYFSNLVPILALSALAYLPVALMGWLLRDGLYTQPQEPLSFLGFLLVATICTQLEVALITVGVFRVLRGGKVAVGESVRTGFRRAPVAFLTAVIVGCLTIVGGVACLVPGIILAMMLAVAVPVAIVESKGAFDALGRSRELTKGNRWSIFAVYLCAGLVMNVPVAVAGFFLRSNLTAYTVWNIGTGWITGAFQAVLACVLYYQLRVAHEDVDLADLAAVFD